MIGNHPLNDSRSDSFHQIFGNNDDKENNNADSK